MQTLEEDPVGVVIRERAPVSSPNGVYDVARPIELPVDVAELERFAPKGAIHDRSNKTGERVIISSGDRRVGWSAAPTHCRDSKCKTRHVTSCR